MLSWLKPARHITRAREAEVDVKYPRFRWQVLEATFIGYTVFYLTRNNLAPIRPEMQEALGLSLAETGDFLAATAISYGIGKFFMGAWSDRSNPRLFMPLGLLLTALVNFCFGLSSDYWVMMSLWAMNGLFQGMGWPPCGRSLGHWFSENERGTMFAVWNIAHNVGGGLVGVLAAAAAGSFGWKYAFFVPGLIAVATALYLLLRLRDTPQSIGLPPIQDYRNDYPAGGKDRDHERELGSYELFVENILLNRSLWIVALANFFVYIARYSPIDLGPSYLRAVRGADAMDGGYSTLILEWAGIPSTLLLGWVSDKLGGRRGLVSLLCMVPVFLSFLGLWLLPAGYLWLDLTLFGVIGFFIYPPVMLLGVAGLDLTSKKAVGTAAGFIGLFGYIGRTVESAVFGRLVESGGWGDALLAMVACTIAAMFLLLFTINLRPRA